MAENLMAKQFRGGDKGFIEGHYAVWQNGIRPYRPNLKASEAGKRNAIALLKTKSTHFNSDFSRLIDYLKKIQQKEENKERNMLYQELNRVSAEFVDDKLKASVRRAIDNGDFGIAYELIIRRKETLKKIRSEMSKSQFQSPQKMASFWEAQFFKYLEKKLNEGLELSKGQLYSKIGQNLTISDIVDEWIETTLAGNNGIAKESLTFISNITKQSLVNFFTNTGIENLNPSSNLFDIDYNKVGTAKPIREVAKQKRKTGGSGRTKKTKINDIVDAFWRGTYKGLSTELMALQEQGSKKSATFSTGDLQKYIYNELVNSDYLVQQKADTISVVAYESSTDLSGLAKDLYMAYAERAENKIDGIKNVIDKDIGVLDNLFVIETNVKGYLGYGDLNIEGSGNFALRMNNLAKLRGLLPNKTADKLIFLLVNTFDECVASQKIYALEQYFAAAIAAWMWDDYDQFFDINEQTDINRVRMFKSGSMYYSASQTMKQGIADLEKDLRTDKKDSFINVNITPPSFNASSIYEDLINRTDMMLTDEMSEAEQQATLQKRWNHMRDLIMEQGQFSISINQKQLDKLLGNLKDYV